MADENLLIQRAEALGIAADTLEDTGKDALLAMEEGTFNALKGEIEHISPELKAGVVNTGAGEYFLAICQAGWVPVEHVEAFAMAFPEPHAKWPGIDTLQESENPEERINSSIRFAVSRLYAEECVKIFPDDMVAPLDEVRNLSREEVIEVLYNKPLEDMVKNGELNTGLLASVIKKIEEEREEIEDAAIVDSVLKEEQDASYKMCREANSLEEQKRLKGLHEVRRGIACYIVDGARNRGVLQNEARDGFHPALVKALKDVWALNEGQLNTIERKMDEKAEKFENQIKEALENVEREKIKELKGELKEDLFAVLKDVGVDLDERLPKQKGQSEEQDKGQSSDAKGKDGKDAEEKAGLKKFMNTKNVVGAAIVATLALVTALVMKNKGKDNQPEAGMGRG